MATRTTVVVTDDLDHSTDNVGTYRFALDGVEYEIDLAAHNLARLREALAPYVAAGRRLPKRPAARRNPGARDGRSADAEVREFWAAHQQRLGLPPYRRHGPIPQTVRDAHRDNH
ncbi:Lsr2 family protein [Micromonospora sp. WMMD712]|uniref:histone-like nucleoid-structuring protein Lsr2 n=1 Tax=Micromonospora sp. WMMD712 TaxID=3016096 RepID=UPI00249A9A91|nr:Lsr2 family protein [Micromonospora sp. WMMD712]WFE59566.1 Lsr2 family protein [Micromonospora sp. WMMD712]